MAWQQTPTLPLYLANAGVSILLALLVWRRRTEHGGPALIALVLGVAVSSLGQGLADASTTVPGKFQWIVFGSFGFGLAIVESIADGHGWSVTVCDAPPGDRANLTADLDGEFDGACFEFTTTDE